MMKTANKLLKLSQLSQLFYTKSFHIMRQHYKVIDGLFNSAVAYDGLMKKVL